MKHTLWHHIIMIVYSEFINLIWLAVGLVVAIAGWSVVGNTGYSFGKYALGLPLILAGASLFLFKIHEVILVVVRPLRLTVICIFCHKNAN